MNYSHLFLELRSLPPSAKEMFIKLNGAEICFIIYREPQRGQSASLNQV